MFIIAALKRHLSEPLRPFYALFRSMPDLLILIAIMFVDPFGFSNSTDERSKDVFYQVTSPFYPDTARDNIAVILIDDASLDTEFFDWPPSFDQYDTLLSSVATYAPKAVFFDLLFLDPRGQEDDLEFFADNIRAIRDFKDTPVFAMGAASIHAGTDECFSESISVLPQIGDAVTDLPFFRFSGYGNDYPMYTMCNGRTLLSPAAELLKAVCSLDSNGSELDGPCPDATLSNVQQITKTIPEAISIRWGEATAPINQRLYPASFDGEGSDCVPPSDKFIEKLLRSASYFIGAFSERLRPDISKNCIYHPHMSAFDLIVRAQQASHVATADKAEQANASRKILEDFLNNKVVLIGLDVAGVRDTVISPVQGTIPGVMAHAMALDNALVLGSDMQHAAPVLFWEADGTDAIEIAGLLVLTLLRWRLASNVIASSNLKPGSKRSYVRFALMALGCVVFFFALIAATFFILRWSPINWIGLIGLGWAYIAFCYSTTMQRPNADGYIHE
ncbi:CHASE2 domain-containing protein [Thalassospira sp. ER-Se-21-Dark]|uniref:CHASE2 domain-containing protein n=1 Tax=Thalassospira sp. ER-Se-21-Dark TaxID=2585190 RepID=UPI001B3125B5|nr:CHASE2 domain-containing protein [Thalassospira sp. ER-Se-21-Dark]MBP3124767.1 CHASE2 domain-containing protein [Thalassospira sp. ER-Se-21-Dark]